MDFPPFMYLLARSVGGRPLRCVFQEGGGIKILLEDGRKVYFTETEISKAKGEEAHPEPVAPVHPGRRRK